MTTLPYVDGFLAAVPKDNREAYLASARASAPVFSEYGAIAIVEAWGDDVPHGKQTDFYRAVAATDDEVVVFSWILWPTKAIRDAGMARVMTDPRLANAEMPFDTKRMVFGGFQMIMDTTREATMGAVA